MVSQKGLLFKYVTKTYTHLVGLNDVTKWTAIALFFSPT